MSDLWHDIRHGLRALARSPGSTGLAIVTLAVALGASTTVFSVVNGILLDPLPYSEPEGIVDVSLLLPPAEGRPSRRGFLDAESLQAWRESGRTIEHLAAYRRGTVVLTGRGDPARLTAARVSPSLFPLLRAVPAVGRALDRGEEIPGAERVAVLGHDLWQRRFRGDLEVVGEGITLDGEPHIVVGVMPAGFFFPDREVELWTPLARSRGVEAPEAGVSVEYFPAIARLADGIGPKQAKSEARAVVSRVMELGAVAVSPGEAEARVEVVPLRERIVEEVDGALAILSAAVGLVLLVACVNLASLLLARNASRQEELAVRSALGADRSRLLRQGITESVVLGLAGGTAGVLVAFGLHSLVPRIAVEVPRIEEVSLDARVFLFAFLLSVLTGVVFGILPAWRASATSPVPPLHGGSGVTWTGGRTLGVLVVVEVALAVVLLVGAGLLLRSFLGLLDVELGYEPRGVVTTELKLEPGRNGGRGWSGAPLDELLERLEGHPGVEAAGVVSYPPLPQSFAMTSVEVEGLPPGRRLAVPQWTSPGYREAIGMRLAEGRWLTPEDHARRAPVAVVNEAFVARNLPGERAVGRRVRIGDAALEIVGVVETTRLLGLDSEPQPELFTSYHNAPAVSGSGATRLTLALRTRRDAPDVMPALRTLLRDLDPYLPVDDAGALEARLSASVARPRFYAVLLGAFAGIALLLAAAGLYGVLAYSVARRTREIGIRRALGARRRQVLGMVLGRGVALVLAGLVLGVAASLGATRVLAHLLFNVTPTDPLAYGAAGLLLLLVGVLASAVPARRANSVEPREALRHE